MMSTTLHVPAHSSATTIGGVDFDVAHEGFASETYQLGLGQFRLQIMRGLSSWLAAGAMMGTVQIVTPAQHGVTRTLMTPSFIFSMPGATSSLIDNQVPAAPDQGVYSPEYDHEVIFTEMLAINVDELPEFEPQIRPTHFPTT